MLFTRLKLNFVNDINLDFIVDSYLRKAFIRVARDQQVVTNWRTVASQLGLTESELADIEQSTEGLRDKCSKSLTMWRDKTGSEANLDLLVKHLRRCKYNAVAG